MQEPRTGTDCDGSVLLAKTTDCFSAARLAMTGRPGRVKGFLWATLSPTKNPLHPTNTRHCEGATKEHLKQSGVEQTKKPHLGSFIYTKWRLNHSTLDSIY